MARKAEYTPNHRIRSALRRLWLRSRERSNRLKVDGYACQRCGRKQSRAKGREIYVEVHHRNGVNWEGLADLIRERLLVHPDNLETLCRECHEKESG